MRLFKLGSQWTIRCLTIGILGYYLIMTISGYFIDEQHVLAPSKTQLIIGTIVALGSFALIWGGAYWLANRYVGWLVTTLIMLTIPKFLLIYFFKIKPASDMYSYSVIGGSSASGDSWKWLYLHNGLDLNTLFPHVIHISSTFGWIDRFFINRPLTIQLFNLVITLITAVLFYYLGRQIGHHFIGVLAALVFYLMPNYYIYSVLLGAEPLWLLCLTIAMLCFNRWRLGHWSMTNGYYWSWLSLTIIFLTFAQLIRPIVLIWALAFVIFTVFTIHDNHVATHSRTRTAHQLSGCLLILTVFLVFMTTSPKIDRQIYHIPFTTHTSLYSLVVGSNYHAKGMYDPILINQLEKINHHCPRSQRDRKMVALLRKQLSHNLRSLQQHHQWLSLLTIKNRIISQPIYGLQLFKQNTRQVDGHPFANNLKTPFSRLFISFNFGFQMILNALAILSLLVDWPNSKHWRIGNGLLLMAIILDGVLIASSLVEVQSRYQVSWYLPMIILAASAMGRYEPDRPNFKAEEKQLEAHSKNTQ